MKTFFRNLLLGILAALPGISLAQNNVITAVDDIVYAVQGQDIIYNVTDNDIFTDSVPIHIGLEISDPCFLVDEDGNLSFYPEPLNCCGEHHLLYYYQDCPQPSKCVAEVKIIVVCPKPDCYFHDLEDLDGDVGDVCENSTTTLFVTYNPGSTYDWIVAGGTFVPGPNPASIIVTWGPAGFGGAEVTITENGVTSTINAGMNILEGPVASFTTSSTNVCQTGSVNFSNTSTGGSSYFWDFGDGTTSTMPNPTHTYAAAGTYSACLYATRNIINSDGGPVCCCMDTVCVDIVVDSLQGPPVFCVSTLCAHASTKYWTDAANCGSLNWTVLDHNGLPVVFSGQGNDTISVQWGDGPFGTVSLEVMNCDIMYCEEPTTVTIPIISSTVEIEGDNVVCENTSATYTVPKWIGTTYEWDVTGAVSWTGDGTNSITVYWGNSDTGTIELLYYSEFLAFLPGQDNPYDCAGTASLVVEIKDEFYVEGPDDLVCVNDVSVYTTDPSTPANWTITPAASFTGQGTDAIIVTWDTGPGIYTITATPVDTSLYCNDVAFSFMKVFDMPSPLGIDGPTEVCPGDTYNYFVQTDQSDVDFEWDVTGGTFNKNGNSVTVTWNASPPYNYALWVRQFRPTTPMCSSDTIWLTVMPKLLDSMLIISGPDSVCINSLQDYSAAPPQHADATYNWTISPEYLGSVVGGQGTPNIQVQWNNTPDTAALTLTVELCNASVSTDIPVFLNSPIVPVIVQNDTLCPGAAFMLDAGPGFVDYLWSPSGATTQTVTTTAVGKYFVTTTDVNGCISHDSYTAVALQPPPTTSSIPIEICINMPNPPASVTVTAPPGAYTYAWACNGIPQATTLDYLIHTTTFVSATFDYTATLTDANGCTAVSTTKVIQSDDCPPPDSCMIDSSASISFTAANRYPDCSIVDFTAMFSNASLSGWYFGDQNSNLNSGTLENAVHDYTEAGCYDVLLYGVAYNTGNHPPDSCTIAYKQVVCVPLAADFSYEDSCSIVNFTDQTSFTLAGDVPVSWSWSFGDPSTSTSTSQNPEFSYPGPGTYTVSLVVLNANGCQDTVVKTITVDGVPVPGISIVSNPTCVGEPVEFFGTAAGAVGWLWDFMDGASNGSQNPLHTYLASGTYAVMLTVTDAEGCTNSNVSALIINPLPPDDVIAAAPGLTVCAGTVVTLTAPAGAGYSYQWSDSLSSTTQSITTSTAGTYNVTVTDANGCTMVPPSVTVAVIPLPQATISGNHYICDDGCVTLGTPYGQVYSYEWHPTLETTRTIDVCSWNLSSPYTVVVTDGYGCSAESTPFNVTNAVSPSFSISAAPDYCEGKPVTLTVSPVEQNVIYSWNNGASGPSTTVTQAGSYYAIGTDTTTGCTGSASTVISPVPDLCMVPVGCYETCNPYEVCGPDGLTAYQWNKDGVPIPGANDQCLSVTESGTYSLTGTNVFGCSLTSDSLMLKVIDCSCLGLSASATPAGNDSCCWSLSYKNTFDSLYGMSIHSLDADLNFDLSTLDPSLMVFGQGSDFIRLVNSTPGAPLPSGVYNDFLNVCLSNVHNNPQQIVFIWYDNPFDILFCSDTITVESQLARFDTISLCPGETVTIGGMMYSAPNTVVDTIPGMNGACDTIATYTLLLLPQLIASDTISLCPGETVTIGGNMYTAPATVIDTLPGMNGVCDTIITYTLLLQPQLTASDTISLCPGETVTIGGVMYTAPNTVIDTIPGASGTCDTIITYTLLLLPQLTASDTISLCPGETVIIGGNTYTAPVTVVDTLPGMNGVCDTIITYTLLLLPQLTASDTISLCPGESITIGGNTYTAPATVVDTLPGMNGECDTIITYTLLLLPQPTASDTISLCPGETVTIGGNMYTAPATVIDTIPGMNGACDTIATYTLLLLPQPMTFDTMSLCPGATVTIGGVMYSAPATVVISLPAMGNGCDTLATYELLLLPVQTLTLNCPANITVEAALGATSAVVSYADPTATSTCPGSVPVVTQISGPLSGDAFPLGTTTICFMAEDDGNCCNDPDTCCFTVTVVPPDVEPCDEATINCIKYELIDITKDAAGNQTYRIRVTNNCAAKMIYAAFQLPTGLVADEPLNNSVYTAPSGHEYDVRNPNFSPFYSIRFKSTTDSISNGESEVFEYVLPPQIRATCLLATVRLYPKVFHQAHLCCTKPSNLFVTDNGTDVQQPAVEIVPEVESIEQDLTGHFSVFPNPTDGTLFADLTGWQGEQLQIQVFNSQGQRVQLLTMQAIDMPQQVQLPEGLSSGLYILEVLRENGEKQSVRFVIQR